MNTEHPQTSAQKSLVESGFWRCCLNCEHWGSNAAAVQHTQNGVKDQCHKWHQVPPPDVILYGCPGWEHIVPF